MGNDDSATVHSVDLLVPEPNVIKLVPLIVPSVELNQLPYGFFKTKGWDEHPGKPMESVANRVPWCHLNFTFLVTGPDNLVYKLDTFGYTVTRSDKVWMFTAPLEQWVNSVRRHCRLGKDPEPEPIRRFYNAVQMFLTFGGLDRLWGYKRPLPDGTFTVEVND